MIRITNLRLDPLAGLDEVRGAVRRRLKIEDSDLLRVVIARSAIDARRGRPVTRVVTAMAEVRGEERVLRRAADRDVSRVDRQRYEPPERRRRSELMPAVVGMGPAGLFAALFLVRAGIPCVVLERGGDIDSRAAAVERYWATGVLDRTSNVQFGEGGAGAFSDGKLTTGTHDGRISAVLETLHGFGAPEDILWSYKPHVGTDILRDVVKNIRAELVRLGCDVRFFSRVCDFGAENGALRSLMVTSPAGEYELRTDAAVLAVGHSARDVFSALDGRVPMEPKPFAVGVRIEHRQADISRAQLGELAAVLPPPDYRLAEHLPGGRSVFSFCVCPGGVVVASASDDGEVVTNGMSYRARDGVNINGALLVGVSPADFGGGDALSGVRFQQHWERRAFDLGGGDGCAPAQTAGDFLTGRPSAGGGRIEPSYRPGVRWCALDRALPDFAAAGLREALPRFGRKVAGFDAPDAVLTGIESRSSSPVRILRSAESLCSPACRGLYPCGEGAGFAGGIVSAAVDGIRVAEAIISAP